MAAPAAAASSAAAAGPPLQRITDAERTRLVPTAQMQAWVQVQWNHVVFDGGFQDLVNEYARAIERANYMIAGRWLNMVFSHGRATLVALSDRRLWAFDAFLRRAQPIDGVDPIPSRHHLPDFGPFNEAGDRLSAIGDPLFEQLSNQWSIIRKDTIEDAVIKALLEMMPHSIVWPNAHGSTYVNIYDHDEAMARGRMEWGLALFTRPMLTHVKARLALLLPFSEHLARDNEVPVAQEDSPTPYIRIPFTRTYIDLGPDALMEDGEGFAFDVDDPLRARVDALEHLLLLLSAELDRRSYVQSDAASTFLHRASADHLAVHSDRQGHDLTGLIGSYVSTAITPGAPVPTRPVSTAQRLIEISREAQNAASQAAANPAQAPALLRGITRKIAALNDAVTEESNKRQQR